MCAILKDYDWNRSKAAIDFKDLRCRGDITFNIYQVIIDLQ